MCWSYAETKFTVNVRLVLPPDGAGSSRTSVCVCACGLTSATADGNHRREGATGCKGLGIYWAQVPNSPPQWTPGTDKSSCPMFRCTLCQSQLIVLPTCEGDDEATLENRWKWANRPLGASWRHPVTEQITTAFSSWSWMKRLSKLFVFVF